MESIPLLAMICLLIVVLLLCGQGVFQCLREGHKWHYPTVGDHVDECCERCGKVRRWTKK